MMLLLLLDVSAHFFQLRSAYGETTISFLPHKRADPDIFMYPGGGDRFYFAKHIGKPMRCPQTDQQMHVVRDSTDGFGHTVENENCSAKVCVQPAAPNRSDERFMILRSKDEMVVETQ